ncbi:hypothetical protein PPERSA_12168 [Pseudocohnilembus persalinus]|uniref:Uncharacterized protein n=1 Tax=Pseudocohnilembus persalinus TaxID=266149 RepID=A0A0V0R8Q9_PSEPJ|nr:hypothetical protein PPERSA_12168 [Pseudocohnilembus persalinus]|eukprot:KRX10886.1 hypothetical protein PPERSA_12168 [Pseudocohnilembus persalinus]
MDNIFTIFLVFVKFWQIVVIFTCNFVRSEIGACLQEINFFLRLKLSRLGFVKDLFVISVNNIYQYSWDKGSKEAALGIYLVLERNLEGNWGKDRGGEDSTVAGLGAFRGEFGNCKELGRRGCRDLLLNCDTAHIYRGLYKGRRPGNIRRILAQLVQLQSFKIILFQNN